jgi:hypothetical protein
MLPSLGLPITEHIINDVAVTMRVPEIVAMPPRMDVPPGIEFIPNRSHVSELVPTNGGTVVTWARAVIANNRQKIVAHQHAIKGIRVSPS